MGELRSAVDALAVTDPDDLDNAALGALLVEVSVQADRLAALRARLTAAHDRRAAWRGDGARSEKEWLAERCRLSPGEAGSRAEFARRLAELPATTEAFIDGTINAAHARAAAHAVRDLPVEAAGGLDRLVAETGATVDAGRLRAAVDDYAHRTCADSLAGRERRAWRNRRVTVARTADGGVAVDGRLDPVGGETVLTALAALSAPVDAGDDRTAEQRRADALVTLGRQALDQGELPQVGGQRPHITVTSTPCTASPTRHPHSWTGSARCRVRRRGCWPATPVSPASSPPARHSRWTSGAPPGWSPRPTQSPRRPRPRLHRLRRAGRVVPSPPRHPLDRRRPDRPDQPRAGLLKLPPRHPRSSLATHPRTRPHLDAAKTRPLNGHGFRKQTRGGPGSDHPCRKKRRAAGR